MKNEHTPGPWKVLPEEEGVPYIRIRGTVFGSRYRIANVLFPDYEGASLDDMEETRANARRIVACLNACRGIPTEMLDKVSVLDLVDSAKKQ